MSAIRSPRCSPKPLDQAKDAAEAIAIEWEALPTVTETRIAADEGAAELWPQSPRNVCFVFDAGNRDAVEQALAAAKHKVSVTYPINRITAVTMEPRTALGGYDPVTEAYTLHCGLQNPHAVRESLANDIFRIPGNRVRVVSPDVGGGFGLKEAAFPEYVLTLVGAKLTGRPVLWAADRGESFLSDFHARDVYATTTLGLDENGQFPRAEGRDHRQYRRLYLADGPACPDQQSRRACGRVSHAAYPFARHRRVLQHAADRALSRRRAPRGDLRDRARDRCRRAAMRLRSGRACAAAT